jgi:hypothetical protein
MEPNLLAANLMHLELNNVSIDIPFYDCGHITLVIGALTFNDTGSLRLRAIAVAFPG